MIVDLVGKTATVTGSTEGIGFAIARGLAEAGAAVVVDGRTLAKVDAAVGRLGGDARGVAADLGNADGCAALVDAVPAPKSSSATSACSNRRTSSSMRTTRSGR